MERSTTARGDNRDRIQRNVDLTYRLWQSQSRVASTIQDEILPAIQDTIIDSFKNTYGAHHGQDTSEQPLWKRRLEDSIGFGMTDCEGGSKIDPEGLVRQMSSLKELILTILFQPAVWIIVMQQQRSTRLNFHIAEQFHGRMSSRQKKRLVQAEHFVKLAEIEDRLNQTLTATVDALITMDYNFLFCASFLTILRFSNSNDSLNRVWSRNRDWFGRLFKPQKPLTEDLSIIRALTVPEEVVLVRVSRGKVCTQDRSHGFIQSLKDGFSSLKKDFHRNFEHVKENVHYRTSYILIPVKSYHGRSVLIPQFQNYPFSSDSEIEDLTSVVCISDSSSPALSRCRVPFSFDNIKDLRAMFISWTCEEAMGQQEEAVLSKDDTISSQSPSPLPTELYLTKRSNARTTSTKSWWKWS